MKQLALALTRPKAKRTWGGRRRNAGRRPALPGRRRVPHVARPRHARANPVHVTIRAKREVAFLRAQHVFSSLRAGIRAAQRASFCVIHFSVQGDHVHLLVEANDGAALRSGMQGLTTRLARAINKALRRRGKVWADRHHRHELTKPREVRNALAYVLLNHRKHGARDAPRSVRSRASMRARRRSTSTGGRRGSPRSSPPSPRERTPRSGRFLLLAPGSCGRAGGGTAPSTRRRCRARNRAEPDGDRAPRTDESAAFLARTAERPQVLPSIPRRGTFSAPRTGGEMADAAGLGSAAERRGGSSPPPCTSPREAA